MNLISGTTRDGAISRDPRISKAQLSAMRKIAGEDKLARFVGMDAEVRPVVEAKLGGATEGSRFAILRNGAPRAVTLPLIESWS